MQQNHYYTLIADAIDYIEANSQREIDFKLVARNMGLSRTAFELIFNKFAGVSANEFFQSVSIGHARNLLRPEEKTLFSPTERIETAKDLHRVNIEQMTALDYQNGGAALVIHYSFSTTKFGKLLLASTKKGVCYLAFYDDESIALKLLNAKFTNASYAAQLDLFQENALAVFTPNGIAVKPLQLHLKATDFQLKVWNELLKIPMGELSTYGKIAKALENPNASRAVGTAIGSNPIAFLIPCHRVIQASGHFGGYMWGKTRKIAMIGWELARSQNQ